MQRKYIVSKALLFYTPIAIIAVCCKTTRTLSSIYKPTESDVVIARIYWPQTSLDTLKQGYVIYKDKCANCHAYKKPEDFQVHELSVIMHKMDRKAKLNLNEDTLILHYLLTKRQAILGTVK